MYKTIGKPLLDFLLAFFGLLLTSPIWIPTAIVLFFQNKGKIFFFQERPGKNQKPFYIIKFKTMTDKKDTDGNLLPDNQRLTSFGKIIRKLSIDELPQLINVVKGDMSLVGPRPLLFKYIPLYSEEQLKRHEVKPGITGLAQVSGRNQISWEKKFKYDIEYINYLSFLFDLKILWITVKKVIKREGVNQTETRPMQPFNGKN